MRAQVVAAKTAYKAAQKRQTLEATPQVLNPSNLRWAALTGNTRQAATSTPRQVTPTRSVGRGGLGDARDAQLATGAAGLVRQGGLTFCNENHPGRTDADRRAKANCEGAVQAAYDAAVALIGALSASDEEDSDEANQIVEQLRQELEQLRQQSAAEAQRVREENRRREEEAKAKAEAEKAQNQTLFYVGGGILVSALVGTFAYLALSDDEDDDAL